MKYSLGSTFYTSFRDSFVGQSIHVLSGHKLLRPRILCDNYVIPDKYLNSSTERISKSPSRAENVEHASRDSSAAGVENFERASKDSSAVIESVNREKAEAEDGSTSPPSSNIILVDWDGDDDPDNPYNWPALKRAFIAVQVSLLTVSSYMASAIFTPAEEQMLGYFHTTEVKLMLGLTLFVWGYGLSPMFVSAMSESPLFGGRRWIFMIAEFLFLIFQIPTALSKNLAGFVVLRLLAGLCAGPPLSNGPAAVGDMYTFPNAAYVILGWSFGAVCGPFFGPLIGGALSHSNTWRWVFWYLLIQAGVVFMCMLFLFPETSTQALLMKKAKILRKITGNENIRAPGDIEKDQITLVPELKKILWFPIEICIREPVLDLVNLHLTLLYSVVYLFFEAFPIVFIETFDFTLVELGIAYLALIVGIGLAIVCYCIHLKVNLITPIMKGAPKTPEQSFGYSALLASIFVPVGLFIFGWSATSTSHWMGPIIGSNVFAFGTFILFQSYISYIGTLWPTRFASAIASNTVLRSMVGGAFPLFGRVFFKHTGSSKYPVGWGSSILGFASVAMIGLPVYFLLHGAKLREKTLAKWGVTT